MMATLMVRILHGRIKGQDLTPLKKNVPLPSLINRGGFHGPRKEKI